MALSLIKNRDENRDELEDHAVKRVMAYGEEDKKEAISPRPLAWLLAAAIVISINKMGNTRGGVKGKGNSEFGFNLEKLLRCLWDTNAKSRRKLENSLGTQVHLFFCFKKIKK